jgi:hypothetical protein
MAVDRNLFLYTIVSDCIRSVDILLSGESGVRVQARL